MLLRIAVVLILICFLCRWALGRWPWEYMSNQPTHTQALQNARKLLAVKKGADREEILAAHKRLIAMVHPDRGGSSAQVHDANDARDLLLEELPGGKAGAADEGSAKESVKDDGSQD